MLPLKEGIVNWPRAIELLRKNGYDGVINVHGEYHQCHDTPSTMAHLPSDIQFMKSLINRNNFF